MNDLRQIKLWEIEQLNDEIEKVQPCPESPIKTKVLASLSKQIDDALAAYLNTFNQPTGKPGL